MWFFVYQKTAYELRINDWSSDVCSSDLIGDRLHHRSHYFAGRQCDVDALVRIKIDPVPQGRVELHHDKLEAMLIELDRHDDEPGGREGEEPQDEGQLRARKPHHHLMCDELAAAGKIAGVALDIAARAMMGQRDRFAARADVLTRHDIAPGAGRSPRECGRDIQGIARG